MTTLYFGKNTCHSINQSINQSIYRASKQAMINQSRLSPWGQQGANRESNHTVKTQSGVKDSSCMIRVTQHMVPNNLAAVSSRPIG